jgi:hypothetical protein
MHNSAVAVGPRISFQSRNPGWPTSERLPRNLDQALKFGWMMDNETWDSSPDERTRSGTVHLYKTVNGARLQFVVSARATLTFGKLHRE